jgi:uncharacterized protein
MHSIPITLLFIALFAVMYVPLTMAVGLRRAKTGIQFLDGGDETLLRRMRAQGNFAENVPIALLAMAAAEATGLPAWALWAGGGAIFAGRALHAVALIAKAPVLARANGMLLTLFPTASFGLWTLWRSLA